MIYYKLPVSAEICGKTYKIREKADYRQILDVISIMNDTEISGKERAYLSLLYFYEEMPEDCETALRYMLWFISCGNEEQGDETPSMSWEKDFDLIVNAINKCGFSDVRAVEYMHWWTFAGKYMEIGESVFSSIVSIRQKIQKGEKLEKWEQDFYRKNKSRIAL